MVSVEVVWVCTILGEATVKDFEDWFKEEGFTVSFVEEFEYLYGHKNILFKLHDNISKFAIYRLQRGGDMKWFDDYVDNYHSVLSEDFKERHGIVICEDEF